MRKSASSGSVSSLDGDARQTRRAPVQGGTCRPPQSPAPPKKISRRHMLASIATTVHSVVRTADAVGLSIELSTPEASLDKAAGSAGIGGGGGAYKTYASSLAAAATTSQPMT